jgi:hypothetical protein
MLVKILNDRGNKQFIVSVNNESHTCRAVWIDEDLHDYESEDSPEFDIIYVEARLFSVSKDVCIIETRMIEVVEDEE